MLATAKFRAVEKLMWHVKNFKGGILSDSEMVAYAAVIVRQMITCLSSKVEFAEYYTINYDEAALEIVFLDKKSGFRIPFEKYEVEFLKSFFSDEK